MQAQRSVPGCYGSVIAFDYRSSRCKSCDLAERCKTQVSDRARALGVKAAVPDDLPPLSSGARASIRGVELPVASAKLLRRLNRKGIYLSDIQECLNDGANPLARSQTPRAIFAAFGHMGGGRFNSKAAQAELEKNMSPATARSEVAAVSGLVKVIMRGRE